MRDGAQADLSDLCSLNSKLLVSPLLSLMIRPYISPFKEFRLWVIYGARVGVIEEFYREDCMREIGVCNREATGKLSGKNSIRLIHISRHETVDPEP